MNRQQIEKKTAAVIEEQLFKRGYATIEDSLVLMGWLQQKHLEEWRKGKVSYLEKVCCTNLSKLTYFMKQYFAYAHKKGYQLRRSAYQNKKTKRPLRFSKSGMPSIEERYATRIVKSNVKKKQSAAKAADQNATYFMKKQL